MPSFLVAVRQSSSTPVAATISTSGAAVGFLPGTDLTVVATFTAATTSAILVIASPPQSSRERLLLVAWVVKQSS